MFALYSAGSSRARLQDNRLPHHWRRVQGRGHLDRGKGGLLRRLFFQPPVASSPLPLSLPLPPSFALPLPRKRDIPVVSSTSAVVCSRPPSLSRLSLLFLFE